MRERDLSWASFQLLVPRLGFVLLCAAHGDLPPSIPPKSSGLCGLNAPISISRATTPLTISNQSRKMPEQPSRCECELYPSCKPFGDTGLPVLERYVMGYRQNGASI